jgi:hypothetical protein
MHKFRISFLTGLATGYVLGTRAGRGRYEQMKKVARTVADNPTVQQAAGAIQAQAAGLAATAGTKLTDGVRGRVPQLAKDAKAKVGERVPGLRAKNGQRRHGAHGSNGSGDVSDGRKFTTMGQRDPNAKP